MNAFNRLVIVVLALVAAAAGTMGALAALGAVDPDQVNRFLPFRDAWASRNDIDWQKDLPQWALLAGAVALALLALVLLLREVTVRQGVEDRLVLDRGRRGTTVLSTSALRRAVEQEARHLAGVARAEVEELSVAGEPPRARYRVRADDVAHLPTLGRQVAERGAASLAATLGRPVGEITVVMEVRRDRRAATRKRRVE